MRIQFVTTGLFDKGGIARYGRFQAAALREIYGKDEVLVYSLLGHRPGDFEEPLEVRWAGTPQPTRGSRIALSAKLLRDALSHRPDVVISGHVNLGPLALSVARMSGARFVLNVYGLEVWSGLTRARAWALRQADTVISDCHNTARVAIDLGLVREYPRVVWDCVDLERYCPLGEPDTEGLSRYGIGARRGFRILYLSRLSDHAVYKGLLRLMDVVRGLGEGYELIVAGDGDRREWFRAQAEARGILGRTVFAGSIGEEDMPLVYGSADAFYLVSESGKDKGEGLPLTPLEAMACGVPVLLGNEDGSREILLDGGGICCSPADLEAQKAYLASLKESDSRLREERLRARRRVEEAFGYERFVSELGEVLAQPSGGPQPGTGREALERKDR